MAKETKTTKKSTIDARVRAIAESGSGKGVGMPNWFTLPQHKAERVLHIDICKKLTELSNKYGNYPITYLVYFAVGKNAHRVPVFLNGYKQICLIQTRYILSFFLIHIILKGTILSDFWLLFLAFYSRHNSRSLKGLIISHCRFLLVLI